MGLLRKTPAVTVLPAESARNGRSEFTVCAQPPVPTSYLPPTAPPDNSGATRRCYLVPGFLRCNANFTNCELVAPQEVCNA